MRIIILLSTVFLLINSYGLKGQEVESNLTHRSKTIIKEIESEEGNKYELIITLPKNYKSEKVYKVLYYLDGWWLSELVRGSYRINYVSKELEELILVGISLKGDEQAWNEQRNRDYTPSKYDIEKMKITMKSGTVELNEETTGGAEEFIKFMKELVFKEIETSYNIDIDTRGILGHSIGGLFGYYCLINHIEIFNNYILISPSIWWNRSELLTDKNLKKIGKDVNIYVVMGKSENRMLMTAIREMVDGINETKSNRSTIELIEYEGMDHHSILPIGIYKGIENLYRKEG